MKTLHLYYSLIKSSLSQQRADMISVTQKKKSILLKAINLHN